MGLFKKKYEPEHEFDLPPLDEPSIEPPPIQADPAEVHQLTLQATSDMSRILNEYRNLINGGNRLSLTKYHELLEAFTKLAREFEKVYELMRFDIERLDSIERYNEQAFKKRRDLIKQLETDNGPDALPEPPSPQGKGKDPKKG